MTMTKARNETSPRPGASRQTRQRSIIEKILLESSGPLGPYEILDAAHEHAPGLGIATVYRAINKMLGEGRLVSVDMPGEAPRYERSGKKHHHHFRCRECEDIFEIHGCPSDLRKLTPKGFRLEDHDVVLYGVCPPCRQTA